MRQIGRQSAVRVGTTRGAGFMHDDAVQQRQTRPQRVPDPARQRLAGRILQTREVIQIAMVEAIEYRLEGGFQVGEVHDPSEHRVRFATHVDLDSKRMPVQARAFVPVGYVRQAMRRLDLERLEDVHAPGLAAREKAERKMVAMGGLEPPTPAL